MQIFPYRKNLVDWVRDTRKRLGFVAIIMKSDIGASTKNQELRLLVNEVVCTRSEKTKTRRTSE